MLELGIKAPDFKLPDQNGEVHKLSDYLGKKIILYFYPKDNTPGCTKQACGFSERYPQFTEKGAVILGVSKDSVASHKRFEEKYGLAFTLLADPERKVIEAYDVWKEKKNYGKVSMGVVRTTYLIDEQGIIIKANDKVTNTGNSSGTARNSKGNAAAAGRTYAGTRNSSAASSRSRRRSGGRNASFSLYNLLKLLVPVLWGFGPTWPEVSAPV